jgi:thioredoxin-like negative regulator of GroEL
VVVTRTMFAEQVGLSPLLVLLKDGREVDRIIVVQPKQEILRRVQRVIAN